MLLVLVRDKADSVATEGILTVDGVFECYTLENPVTSQKIQGHSAIPNGTYKVVLYMSPKHGYMVPLLQDVPGFDYVEIHPGNTALDTKGCILVGQSEGVDFIGSSIDAYKALYPKIERGQGDPDGVRITVV